MQARLLFLLFALALVVAVPPAAQASFVNMNFEAGSASWNFYNPPGGVSGNTILGSPANYHSGQTIVTYLPPEGVAYLELHPDGPGNSEVAAQTAWFNTAGAIVRGMAAFDAVDYQRDALSIPDPTGIYGDDAAYVEIYKGAFTAQQISLMTQAQRALNLYDIPWERRVFGASGGAIPVTDYQVVGDATSDPWTQWNSQSLGAGTYTLAYRIVSGSQPAGSSAVFEQGLKSHALYDVVPEAGTYLLMGLGLGLVSLYRRRSS